MKVEDYKKQISVAGTEEVWNYGLTCRRLSGFCFTLTVILFFLLQGLTFFVALNADYSRQESLRLALVPLAGPLYCGGRLALAHDETAAVLFLIFAPWLLTLICGTRYRGTFRKIRKAVNAAKPADENGKEESAAEDMEEARLAVAAGREPVAPRPPVSSRSAVKLPVQPAPAAKPPVRPAPFAYMPVPSEPSAELPNQPDFDAKPPVPPASSVPYAPAAAPVRAVPPVQPDTRVPAPQPSKPADAGAAGSRPEPSAPAGSSLEAAEREYKQALEDVLSILNKNK